jgi:hypothetical protein
VLFTPYQLALIRPGICPFRAWSRRHSRHMRKRRKKARARPHRGQRLYSRTLNLFGLSALIRRHVLATGISSSFHPAKGIPINLSKTLPSLSVLALVINDTVIPRVFSILSTWISGKIICSRKPKE